MKNVMVIIALLTISLSGFAKPNTERKTGIEGVIYEVVNGKEVPVPFANIMKIGSVDGTFAGTAGDFQLNLKGGRHTVLFSCVGYKPVEKVIKIKKRKSLEKINIVLTPVRTDMAAN